MSDQKESLSSNRKPDITHVRKSFMVYASRQHAYGNSKYIRGNYIPPIDYGKEDFLRIRGYLRALISHAMEIVDAMEVHQSYDPALTDIAGMSQAVTVRDYDAPEGVVASGLPHLCAIAANANMLIEIAVRSELAEADPGTPWVPEKVHVKADGTIEFNKDVERNPTIVVQPWNESERRGEIAKEWALPRPGFIREQGF